MVPKHNYGNMAATYLHLIDVFYPKPNLNKVLLVCRSWLEEKNIERRITCATRLFQNHLDDKTIRERTGHRSNALLQCEKNEQGTGSRQQ